MVLSRKAQLEKLIKQQDKDDKPFQHRQIITQVKNPPKKEIIFIRKRACILLAEQGYSEKTISEIFNLTERTIYSYLHY